MSTGTFLVQSGLKRIGAASIVQPAAPETIIEGFGILKSMVASWASWGIDLRLSPLNVPGDEIGEPLDSTNAIIDNLALRLAPDFDNGRGNVSEQLKANARIGLAQVKQSYRPLSVPPRQISSTAPRGQGNARGFRRRTYFVPGEPLSG